MQPSRTSKDPPSRLLCTELVVRSLAGEQVPAPFLRSLQVPFVWVVLVPRLLLEEQNELLL